MSSRSQLMLNKYVDAEKFGIVSVQESGSCDKEKLKLTNMKTITDTNKSRNRGSVLYIHNSILSTNLVDISKLSKHIDSAWAITVIDNKRYIVGSIYVKLNYKQAIKETLQMLNTAEEMKDKLKASGVLLMGDFNARHTVWGDRVINEYGQELVDNLDYNLFSITTAPKPTFLCENGGSFIDLVIMSNSIVDQLKACNTDETVELFSGAPTRGHVPLLTALNGYVRRETIVTEKLNVDAINWTEWSGELEKQIIDNIVETSNTDDPEKLWEFMESKISEANSKHGKTKKSTRHSKPYWTAKLTTLCDKMREARKSYMKRNTDRNKEIMIDTKECFDNERKRLCQDFIIESTKSLNAAESADFWKKFKAMFANTCEKGVDPLNDENLGIITENSEIEDKLFDTFFQSKHLQEADLDDNFYDEIMREYEDIQQNNLQDEREAGTTEPQFILNAPITVKEIKAAIKKTKCSNKGLDNHNMHPKMLHNFGETALKLLEKLFNECLEKGQWVWDKAKVIFLKKEGKESYAIPGSYRPISISSYIGKLLEKILAKRIVRYLEAIGVYDPDQEGFTSKRNTIRYLNRLNIQIKSDLLDGKTVIGLFIDFEKAFDSIWKKGLIVKMSKLKISGKILKVIDNFLENRKVMLDVNGEVGEIRNTQAYGLPQGSALSPILFKLYLLDILEEFKDREGISVLKFADDGTVVISEETTELCVESLHQVMESLNNWSSKWRMVINCQKNKTEYLCFGKAKGDPEEIPTSVKLGEKDIKKVSETIVLGLVVDDKLSYIPHSQMIHSKLLGKWANICKYSNNQWGFNQRVIVQIARSLFLTSLHYAGIIWMNTRNMTEIESLWYKVVKAATGAVFNVRKSIAEIIIGIPPLTIQNRINKIKHFLKLNINPTPEDKLRELIAKCYNQQQKSIPVELSSCLKETFQFLEWKVDTYPNDFTEMDTLIVKGNRREDFFTLSTKACTYTKELIIKYTERIWSASVKNELNIDGFQHIPKPSCSRLPVPGNTTRQEEVLLMSLMYTNNLFHSNLYRHTYRVESPLCRKCKAVEETPYHIILQCSDQSEQARRLLGQVISEEELQIEDSTTILNGSRHPPFILACLDILSRNEYSVHIDLQ